MLSRELACDTVRALQTGNPAPLGLFAFGLTTALLQVQRAAVLTLQLPWYSASSPLRSSQQPGDSKGNA